MDVGFIAGEVRGEEVVIVIVGTVLGMVVVVLVVGADGLVIIAMHTMIIHIVQEGLCRLIR